MNDGLEHIEHLKKLFIEGCANKYYNNIEDVSVAAKGILNMEKLVVGLTNFAQADDKENYDLQSIMESIKTDGDKNE